MNENMKNLKEIINRNKITYFKELSSVEHLHDFYKNKEFEQSNIINVGLVYGLSRFCYDNTAKSNYVPSEITTFHGFSNPYMTDQIIYNIFRSYLTDINYIADKERSVRFYYKNIRMTIDISQIRNYGIGAKKSFIMNSILERISSDIYKFYLQKDLEIEKFGYRYIELNSRGCDTASYISKTTITDITFIDIIKESKNTLERLDCEYFDYFVSKDNIFHVAVLNKYPDSNVYDVHIIVQTHEDENGENQDRIINLINRKPVEVKIEDFILEVNNFITIEKRGNSYKFDHNILELIKQNPMIVTVNDITIPNNSNMTQYLVFMKVLEEDITVIKLNENGEMIEDEEEYED